MVHCSQYWEIINHQYQQNNTSEETGLSNVMAPEQCTLSLGLYSVTVCSFGSKQGHGCFSFWSVEGLQGGTDPKSVPHGSVQGLTFHLKLIFFFVRPMYLDLADSMSQLRHSFIPCFVQGPSFIYFISIFFTLSHKPTPVFLFHRSPF